MASSKDKKYSQQFLPPSHKTSEQVIKWLARLFALCAPPPQPLFYTAATLCLSYMHSHFNYTFMYILPQVANQAICILSRHPPPTNLSFTLMLLSFYHMCIVKLTISTYYLHTTSISPTNRCLYVALLLLFSLFFTVVFISLPTYCSPNTFFALLVRACK
jgi:hypothetical protein